MKKVLGIFTLVFFLVMFAGNVLADSDADANASVRGVRATAINNQIQDQSQITNVTGGAVNINSRDLLKADPGANGTITAVAPAVPQGYTIIKCVPFRRFDREQIGRGKGRITEKTILFSSKVSSGMITRLDYVPAREESLASVTVKGNVGEGFLSPMLKGLDCLAREGVQIVRFVAFYKPVCAGDTYGLALGSGGAGSISSPTTGKAIAAGATIGWSRVAPAEYYEVMIWAFGDGPTDPPTGVCPCGGCGEKPASPQTPSGLNGQPTGPKTHEKVVGLDRLLVPAPCPSTPVEREIAERYGYKWPCLTLSHNNGQIHAITGMAWVKHYKCSGKPRDLSAAIEQFKAAEKNLKSLDAKKRHGKEAGILLAQVYKFWAGCIWQLYSRDAAMRFAKEKGLRGIPAGIARW